MKVTKSKACIKYSECYGSSDDDWKGAFMLPHIKLQKLKSKDDIFPIIM